VLTGTESLRYFQGIDYGPNNDAADTFEQTLLQDLAGNAFHVGQCACMYISILTALAEAWAYGQSERSAGSSSSTSDALDALWA
jgi:hypothetical protein